MPQSRLKVGEKEYTFDINNALTVGRMRQIKAWFGPELGRFGPFLQALNDLDPEAVLCLVWMARLEAGETEVTPPNQMADFRLSDFELADVQVEPEVPPEGQDPTQDRSPTPTPDSQKGTQTNSDGSGSVPSRKRATSPAAT